jgi:predicted metal-binding membrane protein
MTDLISLVDRAKILLQGGSAGSARARIEPPYHLLVPQRPPYTPIILWAIAALTILSWAYLIHLSREMSEAAAAETMTAAMGMAVDRPWTPTDVVLAFVMWTVMMIGMMAPSATPVLMLAASARPPRDDQHPLATVLGFGAGYGLVWVGFSAVATLVQWALHDAALLSPAMTAASPRLAGAILIGAGLYQLTPLKNVCLTHCRSPIDFLMTHWRSGATGAVRMGAHHGAYCLGCCWALMAVLFAVGVMNLAWVAALAMLVLVEKVAPHAVTISRAAGVAMLVFGAIQIGM